MDDFVVWENNKYSTGIYLVDTQHKKLVEFTNELFEGLAKRGEEAENYFKDVVKKAVDYVKEHFSTEEKLMQKYDYPEYEIHKKIHEGFVKEIITEVKNYEHGQKFAPNRFVRYLRDWLLEHIAITDRKMGTYLKQKDPSLSG